MHLKRDQLVAYWFEIDLANLWFGFACRWRMNAGSALWRRLLPQFMRF